jgi:hypothetical protein
MTRRQASMMRASRAALRLGPVFGVSGQQLAAAQHGRGRGVPGGGALPAVGQICPRLTLL